MSREKIDIVCFSDIWWDFSWQRHQNILTRFPKDWKILFVEPTSLPILIKEPKRIFLRRKDNIIVASLPLLPLIDKIEKLRWINDNIVLLWLNLILKLNGFKKPVLLYYEPRFSSIIDRINRSLVVYECIDDKLAFSNVPKWMKIYLDILIQKADIIFVTSSNLYNKIIEKKKDDIYFIGNGVDIKHFRKSTTDIHVPDDIKVIKKPIVGYIGAIDEWFDFGIIKKISCSYSDASIVLLGPISPKAKKEIDNMKKFQNVFFIGKKSYDVLPNYLKVFDICIIPFKINELTISVNPIKLYEYMACGKNIVSTSLPEIKKYNDVIYIAKDDKEFIDMIKSALHDVPDIDKLSRIAEEHTWDRKVKEIVKIILTIY